MKITDEMVRAAIESKATDHEGEFPALGDLIGFSGENKGRTVVRAALESAMKEALKADMPGVNYQAWAHSLIGFIRAEGLEEQCMHWCGGWPCPIARPYVQGTKRASKRVT